MAVQRVLSINYKKCTSDMCTAHELRVLHIGYVYCTSDTGTTRHLLGTARRYQSESSSSPYSVDTCRGCTVKIRPVISFHLFMFVIHNIFSTYFEQLRVHIA